MQTAIYIIIGLLLLRGLVRAILALYYFIIRRASGDTFVTYKELRDKIHF